MKNKILSIGFALAVAGVPATHGGTPVSFESLWEGVSRHAPELKAADSELSAARAAEGGAKGHWLPRVMLDARAYRSDDPAMSFMSLLESREIVPADFSPEALNHPLETTYGREALVFDWALFEGGARRSVAGAVSKVREARDLERTAIRAGHYAGTAGAYAALLTLEDETRRVEALQVSVKDMLDRYFIGAKSNPVGYSGLLGLKTLLNRLEGMTAAVEAQRSALRGDLSLRAGGLPGDWQVVPGKAVDFLGKVLPNPANPGDPATVKAAEAAAEALRRMKGAETARLLPRVAVFAEGALHQGDRAASRGYTAGAYLQWNLFDAPSFKSGEEAAQRAQAASARAEALGLQAESDRVRTAEALKALTSNLALLEESEGLMEEQMRTARTLFKNGSINALQMVEVFSRSADLIDQKARAEMEFAQAKVLSALQSGFEETSHDQR